MDDESSLNDHPFFQHLQHSNVLAQACQKGYIIALPPARSLPPGQPFSRDFSLSHILLPSKKNQGSHKIFHTLLSRTLILRGDPKSSSSTLCTVSTRTTSWPERREVAILGEETYYTETFDSFPILHISLPLYGPINTSYLALINAQTLSKVEPVQRAFNDHVGVLLAVLGEDSLPTITQQTQAFLQQLKTTYQLIRNFESNLNDKIDSFCQSLLIGVLSTVKAQQHRNSTDIPTVHVSTIRKHSDGYPLTKRNWAEVCVAIEYLTLTKLSSYITRRLSEIYHEENNILYNASLWAQKFITDPDEDEDDLAPNIASSPTTIASHAQPDPFRSSQSLLAPNSSRTSQTVNTLPVFTRTASQPTPTPPLIFLPHPTTNNPFPNQAKPQAIVAQGHRGPQINPNHKFFQLIGLRSDLACVDFSIPALKLQEVLSTVQYRDGHLTPTELYQAGLMLQSGLLIVNQLIQQALISHYTQPPPALFSDDSATNRVSDLFASNPNSTTNPTSTTTTSSSSSPTPPTLLPSPQPQSPPVPPANPTSPSDLPPELMSICAISAEDQIPLLLYLLVLAPTYTTHSQCLYLCTFSPISTMNSDFDGKGMGYSKNGVGLPLDPAELCLPTSKIESLCISLRAAVAQLYQLYSQQCPNQVYLLQQTHGDRPPAHTNVIRVGGGASLRTSGIGGHLSLPTPSHSNSGGLNIFSGGAVSNPSHPNRNVSPPLHPLSPSNGLSGGLGGGLGGRKDGKQVVSIIVTQSPLDELDSSQIQRLQAEQNRIEAKNSGGKKGQGQGQGQGQTGGKEQNDDEEDFLSTLF